MEIKNISANDNNDKEKTTNLEEKMYQKEIHKLNEPKC